MAIRDLGYRPYEGELLPASHNAWVLLRYGAWRIWGSWLNRIAIIVGALPFLAMALLAGIRFLTLEASPRGDGRTMPELPPGAGGWAQWFFSPDAADWLRSLTGIQFLFFVSLLTLRSGAGVIAEDYTYRAYQFYFAKPVTPAQYLLGRSAALACFVFALVFVPNAFLTFVLAALGPEDQVLERVGLLLPALLDATIIATSTSALAIAVSSLSRSRALTVTAWIVLLFVPFVLGLMVEWIADAEWVHLVSFPSLLWVLGDALYKVRDSWDQLGWYHVAPMLAAVTAAAIFAAHHRIRQAEVIT